MLEVVVLESLPLFCLDDLGVPLLLLLVIVIVIIFYSNDSRSNSQVTAVFVKHEQQRFIRLYVND
jgi:hypothetical protein